MNWWNRYLFTPVAALRPRLFAGIFLAVMTLDIWLTFVHRGPNLGVGGFVVAHFQWLDELQPVPTPSLYIGMMVVTSFCAWIAGLCNGHRLLIAVACLLFTYGWAMSQTDSFQHHYLMSLILFCVCFFPRHGWSTLESAPASPARADASLAIAKNQTFVCSPACAYITLGVLVGIVYFWTTVTKLDAPWFEGAVVQRLTEHPNTHPLLLHSVNLFHTITGGNQWVMMAIATVIMEMTLAFGYFYAVGQDGRRSRASTIICLVLWVLTLVLHGGILLMALSIGLFGYYMLVVGSVYLLPLTWLRMPERWIFHPLRRAGEAAALWMNPGASPVLCLGESVIIAGGLVAIFHLMEMPGTTVAGIMVALILLLHTALDVRWKRIQSAQFRLLATVLFMALVSAIAYMGPLRQNVDLRMAYMQHIAGDPLLAMKYYTKVARQLDTPIEQSGVFNNLGDIMCRVHDYPEAVEFYKTSIAIDPANGSSHANLALALLTMRRHQEAVSEYARALELGFTSPSVHYNYAFALQNLNRSDEAIGQYRIAVTLDPDLLGAHNNLAVLLLSSNQLDEAHHHLREVLRLDPEDVFTMNNLAWLLATKPDRDISDAQQGLTIAIRATTLTQRQHPVVLGTLAECYYAIGMKSEARAAAEEAIRVAQAQRQESVIAQIRARMERYQR